MTETPQNIPLPIPCPRCDSVLSHGECDCGFSLETKKIEDQDNGPEDWSLGHPVLL